ncbi:L-ascorbate metabolism protein UlaG, beta-lactamase superfamily [Variovorax sp. YR634]|uniref:metal-dependent hydrolase n=1 Tax=unclassified Variovorax TaxID=663243 RepID=UPI000896674C|nr:MULTISPECIES: metal-dependent hydrolase [unclassified Variovorax]SDX11010.1 L-ascorbate metabolism protein UlaG, beta-lactamase superfamily [Variovorax sp. YR634]SOD28945.1 L-ascorbate metabolism protein UlaG, beta-lactamase superfamily [Variovorax sp. YR752]
MKSLARLLLALVVAALLAACAQSPQSPPSTSGGKTEVLWLGQSAFRITTPGGKVIVTDPWLKLNPLTPAAYKNLEALGKVDVLLVTHGHFDHFADAPALALLNQVPMYAPGDMNQTVGVLGILPPNLVPRFNKSGTINPVPGIKVTAVHAEHSSVIVWKNPATGKDEVHPGGEPVGYIIELENGFRIYHMGDTGLFADMKFIADYYKPDLVLMPIGGHFTMDPVDAAYATRKWLKPRAVIPMHYGANPLGKGTPDEYIRALGSTSTRVLALKPGEKAIF